jgi:UDP-N-acetyl-D-glucosamine/UDP-N-acetyl-D-galactosamine dehydrogenase
MKNKLLGIIGLGYVGLPLAVEFGKSREVIGFDISSKRIQDLLNGKDHTLECEDDELASAKYLNFTDNIDDLTNCDIYIIAVPTPVDEDKKPNLGPLLRASEDVARLLEKENIIIFESTVFPGATEEVCVPILENFSGLKYNSDFYCGYSPERINPGDKKHRLVDIKKITSGSLPKIADIVDDLYKEIIKAGTHKASSIRVAEAAKVIENTQRDVNIALINELAMLFQKLNIDTEAVLKAAGTKWNFLPFSPGLVGGHCISVDPYYLTYKAKEVDFDPKMILSGRKINDGMSKYIFGQVRNIMNNKYIQLNNSNILVMGMSFKENCPDLRNSLVVDLIQEFLKFKCNVDVFDPLIDKQEAQKSYSVIPIEKPLVNKYDVILITVAHNEFKKFSLEQIRTYGKKNHIIYDVKYLFKHNEVDGRL